MAPSAVFAGDAKHSMPIAAECNSAGGVRSDPSGPLLLRQHQLAAEELLEQLQRPDAPEDIAGIAGDHRELAMLQVPKALLDQPPDARQQGQNRIRLLRLVTRAG